jgi:hypothetical protein
MLTADDLRLRADPGSEYSWAWRIWWQHTSCHVDDADLIRLRGMVSDVHDARAMHDL